MKTAIWQSLLAGIVLCTAASGAAAQGGPPAKADSPARPVSRPEAGKQQAIGLKEMLSHQAVLRGTLGESPVQVTVRAKEIVEDGLEGEYFFFGRSQKILLAGESEGDDIFLEESENGTNISGHWEGKLQGDSITGTWMSADGSVTKPFHLKLMRPQAGSVKPASVRK